MGEVSARRVQGREVLTFPGPRPGRAEPGLPVGIRAVRAEPDHITRAGWRVKNLHSCEAVQQTFASRDGSAKVSGQND